MKKWISHKSPNRQKVIDEKAPWLGNKFKPESNVPSDLVKLAKTIATRNELELAIENTPTQQSNGI